MSSRSLPTLQSLIQSRIKVRILASLMILVSGAVFLSLIEAALSYSDLVTQLDDRARNLEGLIISEVLVNNHQATKMILDDFNNSFQSESVKWVQHAGELQPKKKFNWNITGSWQYFVPLKKVGNRDFGIFIFEGNIFKTVGMLNNLYYRIVIALFICMIIAMLILPIGRKAAQELIVDPISSLISLLKEHDNFKQVTKPAYAEIDRIHSEFNSLIKMRKNIENQRIETEKLKSVASTAQMLAHDIRRPFSLLKATLEGLSQAKTPEAVEDIVKETVPGIKKSLEHLEGIISELSNENISNKHSIFFVSEAVQRALSVSASIQERSSKVIFENISDGMIKGSLNQLERVFTNIISNALEAMNTIDDVLNITVKKLLTTIEVKITNTGSYIDPSKFDFIFDPFYTEGKSNGTGLGLSNSKRIVLEHGGKILIESTKEPKSVTFIVSLPCMQS